MRQKLASLAILLAAVLADPTLAQSRKTVATLPTDRCTTGELETKNFIVSDGLTVNDATGGGGTFAVEVVCDGGSFRAFQSGVQTATCADSGNGSASTLTLNPTAPVVEITNADADGCTVTMGETTGPYMRGVVTIVVVSNAGTTVNFADTSGVSELTGAITLAVWDTLSLVYSTARWVMVDTSNN